MQRKRLQQAFAWVQSIEEEVSRAKLHESRAGQGSALQQAHTRADFCARAVDTAQQEVVAAAHERCSSSRSEGKFLESRDVFAWELGNFCSKFSSSQEMVISLYDDQTQSLPAAVLSRLLEVPR